MKRLVQIGVGLTAVLGILFLLAFLLTRGDYQVPRTISEDPTLPGVTVADRRFHLQTFGDPNHGVVIVVHGGPGWDYKSLLPLQNLSDEFFIVFYDQRGSGLSPRVGRNELTLEAYLDDLDAIVDYYANGKRVSLIGHSWGAMLVSAYLGKQPKKVSHAVLAEPGFLTTEMVQEAGISFGPKLDVGFLLLASKIWFQSLHINGPDEQASSDYFLGQVAPRANPEYYCNNIVPAAGTDHWRAGALAMKDVGELITNADGRVEVNLIEGVDQFTEKVLFLATECNMKIGVIHQKKQMKYFPHPELAVIKGSGHMMFAEKPDESVGIVRKYLRE